MIRRKNGRLPKKKARLHYKGNGKNIPNRIDIDLKDKLANERLELVTLKQIVLNLAEQKESKKLFDCNDR